MCHIPAQKWETHDKAHSSELYDRDHGQEAAQDLPAILPLDLAPADGHHEADKCSELGDGRKAHEETGSPPHGAEVPVIGITVLLLVGERAAGLVGKGGVAVVVQAEMLGVDGVAVL